MISPLRPGDRELYEAEKGNDQKPMSTGAPDSRDFRDADWWRQAVVYQIYVRSFADSNGDGIGDLPGVTSRLEYLQSLGVDAIWLTPFYPSPLVDGGYDVSDYRDVEPRFGTLADFDVLVAQCRRRGLRVIADIVPNHSSDQHPWFAEALRSAPGSPARDRYIFRDGRGDDGGLPPTDWRSWFGGSAWERAGDGQWYLHLFDRTQPDLNWGHPEVVADFDRTLRFWSDRGVDGFRVDVAHGMAKDLTPLRDDQGVYPYRRHLLTDGSHPLYDREEVHAIFRRWRTILNEYDPPRAAVAEAVEGPRRTLYARPDELGQSFTFDLLPLGWDLPSWRDTTAACVDEARITGTTCTWVLSNHDIVRHVTRLGLPSGTDLDSWKLSQGHEPVPDLALGARRARALTQLMLALPGSAYLYQGEELGLPEVPDMPRELQDHPMWDRSGHTRVGNDGARVPIPWTADGPSYGFSSAAGWLPQPASFGALSAAAQMTAPGSTLAFYRAALAWRRTLNAGEQFTKAVAPDGVLAFSRGNGWESWTNFSDQEISLPATDVLLSSGPSRDGILPPVTTAWLRRPA
jgi:alpha-glucosidase